MWIPEARNGISPPTRPKRSFGPVAKKSVDAPARQKRTWLAALRRVNLPVSNDSSGGFRPLPVPTLLRRGLYAPWASFTGLPIPR